MLVCKERVDLPRADDELAHTPHHCQLRADRPELVLEHHRRLSPRVILLDLELELGWRCDGCAVELELAVAVQGGAELARFGALLRPVVSNARRRIGLRPAVLQHAVDLVVVLARRVVAPPL